MKFTCYRSLEAQLFNKANELQEDISLKRFDQRVAHLHLAAIRAQVGAGAILDYIPRYLGTYTYYLATSMLHMCAL